ncbi:hypothetical protein OSG_eHP2_00110 [environmental Halophage eHP-2]|nr:hypothetical protein OSG_eHP2_00110 [environmental Halophage eHP-2]
MGYMNENEIKKAFRDDIDTYPFKTTLRFEVTCPVGRIDIQLPDYDIVIEAKSDGDVKRAIGQALCYSEATDSFGYILIPVDEITDIIKDSCRRADIGIITTTKHSLNFKIAHDVGGFETFHPSRYEGMSLSDEDEYESRSEVIVGGVD